MRTEFDFSPLLRSAVGFNRMLDDLRSATRVEHLDNYLPYDIERAGEDQYRVTLAVAGFRPGELTVTAQQNMLVVAGEPRERSGHGDATNNNGERQMLHHGIAVRAFERRFNLADHVKVVGASLSDGLLTIDLRRDVPEARRPRRIEIGTGEGVSEQQQRIESQAA